MSVVMTGQMLDTTRAALTHGPSGATLHTAAPRDNGGDGSSFSPTDLCAVSLGACASTIMSMYAAKHGFAVAIAFEVAKEMAASPRRIGRLSVRYTLRGELSEAQVAGLEAAARTCPVRLSLHPDVVVEESFVLNP